MFRHVYYNRVGEINTVKHIYLKLMKEKQHVILVCPLNWGLGHAARCIPLIRLLIQQGDKVIVAGEGSVLDLLKEEFPSLQVVVMKGVEIKYSAKGFSFISMLFFFPSLVVSVYQEHRLLKRLIKEYKIDVVISDNRYGLWSSKVKSIFITHQLNIMLPAKWKFAEKLVHAMNHYFINKFDECWIPDESSCPVSGELALALTKNYKLKYIGILSRFIDGDREQLTTNYEVLAILSGPEPQRTILENTLCNQLLLLNKRVLLVRGKPQEKEERPAIGVLSFVNHLPSGILKSLLLQSKFIICRSGYSSLMDLAAVGRCAVIIPTPGQTEQEYLAHFHQLKGNHIKQLQQHINLEEAFKEVQNCHALTLTNTTLKTIVNTI